MNVKRHPEHSFQVSYEYFDLLRWADQPKARSTSWLQTRFLAARTMTKPRLHKAPYLGLPAELSVTGMNLIRHGYSQLGSTLPKTYFLE